MSDDVISDLLLQWEEDRQRSPEELCRMHPEAREAVSKRIKQLEAMEWMNGSLTSLSSLAECNLDSLGRAYETRVQNFIESGDYDRAIEDCTRAILLGIE